MTLFRRVQPGLAVVKGGARRLLLASVVVFSPLVYTQDYGANDTEAMFLTEYGVVLATTRIATTEAMAPVAVTVLDRELIEASGAREVSELFRLVPGMLTGSKDGSTQTVSYHLLADEYSRRMQVLIDGRSVYTPAWGGVDWADMPLTIEDIERIEVLRGPDSASYGSNSFLGVINIITREAVLDSGVKVKFLSGTDGIRERHLRQGGQLGEWDYRFALGHVADGGFDNRYDDKSSTMLSFRADYSLPGDEYFSVLAGYAAGDREYEAGYGANNPFGMNREMRRRSHYQQLLWKHSFNDDHSLRMQISHSYHEKLDSYWTPDFVYANLPFDPTFVDYGMTAERHDFDVEYSSVLSESVRSAIGASLGRDKVSAPHLLGSNTPVRNRLSRVFGNVEWQFQPDWQINLGALSEANNFATPGLAWRGGLLHQFSPNHSARVTVSTANRMPSAIENSLEWWVSGTVTGTDIAVSKRLRRGNKDLDVETMFSRSFGYHGFFLDNKLSVDINVFQDDLSSLITDILTPDPDGAENGYSEEFLNLDDIEIRGAEFDINYKPNRNNRLKLALARTQTRLSRQGSDLRWQGNSPERNISLLYMLTLPQGYKVSTAFNYLSEMQGWDSDRFREPVRRLDFTIAREFQLWGMGSELVLSLRNVLNKYEELGIIPDKDKYQAEINIIEDSAFLTLSIQMN